MNFLPSKSRFKNFQQIIKEKKKKNIFVIFDSFLTLGYVEMIKVFWNSINAVPYVLHHSIVDLKSELISLVCL